MGIYVYVRLFDLRAYQQTVLPAYRKFMRGNDPQPMMALAEEAIAKMTPREKKDFDYTTLKEGIGILNGSVFYNSKGDYTNKETRQTTLADKKVFVSGQFAPSLLFTLCTPRIRGVTVEQNMSKTALYDYLYYSSKWVADMFAGGGEPRGGYLKIPLGEGYPCLFSDRDIQDFQNALATVVNPQELEEVEAIYSQFCQSLKEHLQAIFQQDYRKRKQYYEQYSGRFKVMLGDGAELKKEFANLANLLKIVTESPHLKLVMYLT